jgi:hypothetical protein
VLGPEWGPVGAEVEVVPEAIGDRQLARLGLAALVYVFEGTGGD